jgi:hypothetical protein
MRRSTSGGRIKPVRFRFGSLLLPSFAWGPFRFAHAHCAPAVAFGDFASPRACSRRRFSTPFAWGTLLQPKAVSRQRARRESVTHTYTIAQPPTGIARLSVTFGLRCDDRVQLGALPTLGYAIEFAASNARLKASTELTSGLADPRAPPRRCPSAQDRCGARP